MLDWKFVDDNNKDIDLSFSERFFHIMSGGEKELKDVRVFDCKGGVPNSIPKECISILLNYKSETDNRSKDPLRGKTVLALCSGHNTLMFPLDQARDFSIKLFSLAEALSKNSEFTF